MPPLTFDARPLTERLTRRQAVQVLAERKLPTPMRAGGRTAVILLEIGLIILGLWLVVVLPSTEDDPLFILGFVVAFLGLGLLIYSVVLFIRGGFVRTARLALFAEANAMYFYPTALSSYPGTIFTTGKAHATEDIVRGNVPRIVEFGNHRYEHPDKDTTKRWGYIAVQLDAPLPHILLDATANNRRGRSNLPVVFPDARELTLEGGFGDHFRLLCPPGYEADAYYLFTPDVMARFVDTAAQVDVEIIDNWLFFYLDGRRATTLDPDQWSWMFSLVAAMLEKTDAWARWRDGRLAASGEAASSVPVQAPPAGVAAGGKRLRRRRQVYFWSILGSSIAVLIMLIRLVLWVAETFFG